jgi:hypothetical protein
MAITTSSNVIPLSEWSKLQSARLELYVQDSKLQWRFDPPKPGLKRNHGTVVIEQLPEVRPLIEMLTDVQQLLVDLRPDESAQRDVVNSMLYRVAAELGDKLYGVLFNDTDVCAALDEGLKNGNSGTHFLRIELEFTGDSAFMAGWPWEYLHRPGRPGKPESGEFLALSANLVLNRILRDRICEKFSTRNPSLLLVVARPRDLGPVECDDIASLAKRLKQESVLTLQELIEPVWQDYLDPHQRAVASWEAFVANVNAHRPHVIHFIGHGRLVYDTMKRRTAGQLAFVGPDGKAVWIDEEQLGASLNYKELRLVFLQACESAKSDSRIETSGVARTLALRAVPAVVAMQSKVQNGIASQFACTFYDNLKHGLPIDWAVMKGREAINALESVPLTERKLSFGVPVVYLSSYLGLIDPPEEARPAVPQVIPESGLQCPLCHVALKRLSTYCTNLQCGVQLLCNNPARRNDPCARLDDPSLQGTRCGDCGFAIPPRSPSNIQPPPTMSTAAPRGDGLQINPTLWSGKLPQSGAADEPKV